MENAHKIGLGLFALAMGAAVLAMQPQPAAEDAPLEPGEPEALIEPARDVDAILTC